MRNVTLTKRYVDETKLSRRATLAKRSQVVRFPADKQHRPRDHFSPDKNDVTAAQKFSKQQQWQHLTCAT